MAFLSGPGMVQIGHGGYNIFGGNRMNYGLWPWSWKRQRDDWRSEALQYKAAHEGCVSAKAWVSVFLNNALTLLYCVAIALAIWKLRNHMDWKP